MPGGPAGRPPAPPDATWNVPGSRWKPAKRSTARTLTATAADSNQMDWHLDVRAVRRAAEAEFQSNTQRPLTFIRPRDGHQSRRLFVHTSHFACYLVMIDLDIALFLHVCPELAVGLLRQSRFAVVWCLLSKCPPRVRVSQCPLSTAARFLCGDFDGNKDERKKLTECFCNAEMMKH